MADDLHFRRAAERLHVAQPALSQAIRRLEDKLGLELLTRSTRAVALTEAGAVLHREIQQILRQADRLMERAAALAEGELGTLELGYTPLACGAVAKTIRSFSEQHRGIQLTHRQQYTVELERAVDERVLDCAFVFAHELPAQLERQAAFELPLVAVVGEKHPLAANRWIRLQKIEPYPLAMQDDESGQPWRTLVAQLLDRNGVRSRFISMPDPVGRFPVELLEDDEELVVITTDDWAHPSLPKIRFDPVITVPIDLIWRSENVKPAFESLRRHVSSLR